LCWERKTGLPLNNAIVWHDIRTKDLVDKIVKEKFNGDYDAIRNKCGLPINTYFSAAKMKWMIENCEEIKTRVKNNDIENLCFGTIDSWIIYVKKI